MYDDIIDVLTKLLIKQDFKEKQTGKVTYVKKTRIYKDLIKFFKEMGQNTYKNTSNFDENNKNDKLVD